MRPASLHKTAWCECEHLTDADKFGSLSAWHRQEQGGMVVFGSLIKLTLLLLTKSCAYKYEASNEKRLGVSHQEFLKIKISMILIG